MDFVPYKPTSSRTTSDEPISIGPTHALALIEIASQAETFGDKIARMAMSILCEDPDDENADTFVDGLRSETDDPWREYQNCA